MKVLVAENSFKFSDEQKEYFKSIDATIFVEESTMDDLVEFDGGVGEDYVLATKPSGFERGWDSLPIDTLKKLKHLRGIILGTTSFSWVDYKALRENNVSISNTPGKSTNAVAEYCIFCMHGLYRKYPLLLKGEDAGLLEEVKGKTAGICGLGEIGRRTAELCEAAGMKVQYFNRSEKDVDWKKVELETLVKTSDVIFVTISADKGLDGLLNKEILQTMKDDALFITVTHENVYDLDFLKEQAGENKIGGLAYENDEEAKDILKMQGNIFVTAEMAYYTSQTLQNEADIVVETIKSYLEGNRRYVVN